jgi:hypothetical protein
MFDDLVESSVIRKKTNKSWTVTLSFIIQGIVVVVFILIPLIYTEALPIAHDISSGACAASATAAAGGCGAAHREASGAPNSVRQDDGADGHPQES